MPVRERVARESKGALEGAASIVGMADRWGRINKFFDRLAPTHLLSTDRYMVTQIVSSLRPRHHPDSRAQLSFFIRLRCLSLRSTEVREGSNGYALRIFTHIPDFAVLNSS